MARTRAPATTSRRSSDSTCRGGLRIEYQVLPAEGKTPTRDDLGVLRQIIINRIDKSGVAEPQVVIQGNDRVIVEMPGIQNADQIRNLVGTTGRLDFVPLGQTPAIAGPGADPRVPRAAVRRRAPGQLRAVLRRPGRRGLDRRQPGGPADGRLHAQPGRQGPVRRATPRTTSATTSRSSSTARSSPRRSSTARSPTARSRSSQNSSIGGYPLAEAQNLVTILQFGQLPFPIQELANTTVSPTLGEAFLHQSLHRRR